MADFIVCFSLFLEWPQFLIIRGDDSSYFTTYICTLLLARQSPAKSTNTNRTLTCMKDTIEIKFDGLSLFLKIFNLKLYTIMRENSKYLLLGG